MRKYMLGFVIGIGVSAASTAFALCLERGERVKGLNVMLMNSGQLVHCPLAILRDPNLLECVN
jgi:hypothetical protein